MTRTVLITGIQGGIGQALARSLQERGERIIGAARQPGDEPRAYPVLPLDLSSDQSITAFVRKLEQPIDILINNAGIATTHLESGRSEDPFEQITRSEFAQILDVNVVGTFLLTRELIPSLMRGTGRLIINISSNLGSIANNQTGGRYAYRCSKAALNMLTRSLAADLASQGFTCLAWHPGWVQTRMGGAEADISAEESAEALAQLIPMISREHNGRFFDYRHQELPW